MTQILGFNRHDVVLCLNLFKMNVRDRYLGSSLGSVWAVANPFFLLGVYTFVFGFVFKVRLPGAETTLGYVLWLISGYGAWMATTESLLTATSSVASAAGLVKNMVFKTELLPIAASLMGLISLAVSLFFLLVLKVFAGSEFTWHILCLPIIILIHFLFVCSLGLWLAAINVFVRDVAQALPNLLTVLMFMTPIFYSIESMPRIVQKISIGNPLYLIAESYRRILLGGEAPRWGAVAYVFLLSLVILTTGLRAFRQVKGRFNSAL